MVIVIATWSMAGYDDDYLCGGTYFHFPLITWEAATIDGAKSSHVLRYIILPLLMPSVTQFVCFSSMGEFAESVRP